VVCQTVVIIAFLVGDGKVLWTKSGCQCHQQIATVALDSRQPSDENRKPGSREKTRTQKSGSNVMQKTSLPQRKLSLLFMLPFLPFLLPEF